MFRGSGTSGFLVPPTDRLYMEESLVYALGVVPERRMEGRCGGEGGTESVSQESRDDFLSERDLLERDMLSLDVLFCCVRIYRGVK